MHEGTDLHDLAIEFMARDQWCVDHGFGRVIVGLDVQVGAADSGGHHPDLDVVDTGFRFRPVDKFQTCLGIGLVQCFHRVLPSVPGAAGAQHVGLLQVLQVMSGNDTLVIR